MSAVTSRSRRPAAGTARGSEGASGGVARVVREKGTKGSDPILKRGQRCQTPFGDTLAGLRPAALAPPKALGGWFRAANGVPAFVGTRAGVRG